LGFFGNTIPALVGYLLEKWGQLLTLLKATLPSWLSNLNSCPVSNEVDVGLQLAKTVQLWLEVLTEQQIQLPSLQWATQVTISFAIYSERYSRTAITWSEAGLLSTRRWQLEQPLAKSLTTSGVEGLTVSGGATDH
jgi:hypothetical protein